MSCPPCNLDYVVIYPTSFVAHVATKGATRDVFDIIPTEEAVWQSTRLEDVDMSKKVRSFLWEHARDIYRFRKFWNNTGNPGGR